ncbi:hypothetical protein Agabi119p4_5068 [Agaricus bisporus var. burnettii]|uniref:Uncharacterized protein n=1 Tax=Agaricus bisporus var. burnettii TaxID=192524 RepID=A0A8H7F4E7_AGABI|nr:hypothetical protein Agabi119p4_5068 [Agaricus bisporus var. burnettii]
MMTAIERPACRNHQKTKRRFCSSPTVKPETCSRVLKIFNAKYDGSASSIYSFLPRSKPIFAKDRLYAAVPVLLYAAVKSGDIVLTFYLTCRIVF